MGIRFSLAIVPKCRNGSTLLMYFSKLKKKKMADSSKDKTVIVMVMKNSLGDNTVWDKYVDMYVVQCMVSTITLDKL